MCFFNTFQVLGNATCWISRRRCLTLFFMTGVLFFIIDKRILSQKKHWWNNKNISFILNNLNLSFSSYDKPRSVYTLYHVLKTRISDVCSFPPNGLCKYVNTGITRPFCISLSCIMPFYHCVSVWFWAKYVLCVVFTVFTNDNRRNITVILTNNTQRKDTVFIY